MRRNDREVRRKFIYGIGILFVFIAAGIFAVETQLNTLTLESEFAKVLNLKRDQTAKELSFYFLGERISLGEWEMPTAELKDDYIVVRLGGEKETAWPIGWLRDLTGKNREDAIRNVYVYYKKAREAARDMRETMEEYYGAILEDLNYYF